MTIACALVWLRPSGCAVCIPWNSVLLNSEIIRGLRRLFHEMSTPSRNPYTSPTRVGEVGAKRRVRASNTTLTRVPRLKAGVRDLSHFVGEVYDGGALVWLRPTAALCRLEATQSIYAGRCVAGITWGTGRRVGRFDARCEMSMRSDVADAVMIVALRDTYILPWHAVGATCRVRASGTALTLAASRLDLSHCVGEVYDGGVLLWMRSLCLGYRGRWPVVARLI